MSLTDPDRHWWRTNATRRAVAHVCVALGVIAGFIGPYGIFSTMDGDTGGVSQPVALVCTIAAIPLLVGGSLLRAFGVDGGASASRITTWSIPLYFTATGLGAVFGVRSTGAPMNAHHAVFVVFAIGGVIAIIVMEVLRLRSRSAAAMRDRIERHGVTARGIVTRSTSYSRNHRGRPRWTRATIPGSHANGAAVTVRYSPTDRGNAAAVIVTG